MITRLQINHPIPSTLSSTMHLHMRPLNYRVSQLEAELENALSGRTVGSVLACHSLYLYNALYIIMSSELKSFFSFSVAPEYVILCARGRLLQFVMVLL